VSCTRLAVAAILGRSGAHLRQPKLLTCHLPSS